MDFFKLRSAPENREPDFFQANSEIIWSAYKELGRTQWASPADIESSQLRQLRTLLLHCVEQIPYYAQLFAHHGISPRRIESMDQFRKIPVLQRRVYQQNLDSFRARQLPIGTTPTGILRTSGSSGSPTVVLQTNVVNVWWSAFFLRDLQWSNIDPTGSIAAIRSSGKKGPILSQLLNGVSVNGWVPHIDSLIHTGKAHLMDIGQGHEQQLQWLRNINPDYLLSYPANLEVLANHVAREGALPGLKAIQAISDTLSSETKAYIESVFGVPVKNTYSCAEAGYLASPCPDGHGLHVHSENVLFEVVDEVGNPCKPGETGRVLITTLHNFRAPFVRYDVGDQVTLASGLCPCGRSLPLLSAVQGKDSPMFHLPCGKRKSSTRLAWIVRKIGGHWHHQVVQKSLDQVLVRIVPDPEWSGKHVEEIRRAVRDYFDEAVTVTVETHSQLENPPHGKFQNMVVEFE